MRALVLALACVLAAGPVFAATEVKRTGLSIGGRAAYLEPDNNNGGDGQ